MQIAIEAGTIIYHSLGLSDGRPSRIFDLGGPGQPELINSSIYGEGGRFTIDFSNLKMNMDVAAVRVAEARNFKLANFNIKDNRTEFASILIAFVNKRGVAEPWCHNGIVENISQTNAHTGYGLIQAYAADNILFKNLSCEGGVTLRLETDDREMKAALKGGIRDIFAYKIKGINGICPVMFSPHFAQNGNVTIENVKAVGCAYAIRIEHGFLEIFADNSLYPTNARTHGIRFKEDLENILGEHSVSVFYKRNRGRNWAARIANAFTEKALNSTHYLIEPQLRGLNAGMFKNPTITNVSVTYKNQNTAKIKQGFLRYLPCNQWNNVIKPTDLNVPNGFEYHGPSLGVLYDTCTKSESFGNYKVEVSNINITNNFPVDHLLYVTHNIDTVCDERFF